MWKKHKIWKSKVNVDGYMLEDSIGEIVMIAFIVFAVGIFVGSRVWMVFRK